MSKILSLPLAFLVGQLGQSDSRPQPLGFVWIFMSDCNVRPKYWSDNRRRTETVPRRLSDFWRSDRNASDKVVGQPKSLGGAMGCGGLSDWTTRNVKMIDPADTLRVAWACASRDDRQGFCEQISPALGKRKERRT